MKSSQYSVKVYETTIEDEDKFMAFFDVNYILFKDYLIVIQGELSQKIENYLRSKELHFLNNTSFPKTSKSHARKVLEEELTQQKEKQLEMEQLAKEKLEYLSAKLENNLTVMDSMIRSGREVNIEGDLLLMNRVNSGATIKTSGNLIITQVVEGAVRCDGKFMMLSASPKANIVFNGVEVNGALLEEKLNRVELKHNEIVITPILKKEINWV